MPSKHLLSNPMLVSKVRELAERRVELEAKQGLLGAEAQNGGGVGEKDRKAKRKTQKALMKICQMQSLIRRAIGDCLPPITVARRMILQQ